MMDLLATLLGLPFAMADLVAKVARELVLAAFGFAILGGIMWSIRTVTRPAVLRIERTRWWVDRFGYRHSFWNVAIPSLMAVTFIVMVATVIYGYAVGILPAR
jgi:hypothetical protein